MRTTLRTNTFKLFVCLLLFASPNLLCLPPEARVGSGTEFIPIIALLGFAGGSGSVDVANTWTADSEADLDGDGTADGTAIDADGDGVVDGIDINNDGVIEFVALDLNGDGIPDAIDVDGDGQPDYYLAGDGQEYSGPD